MYYCILYIYMWMVAVQTMLFFHCIVVAGITIYAVNVNKNWRSVVASIGIVVIAFQVGVFVLTVWQPLGKYASVTKPECYSFDFDVNGLTIGQVASASSAAVGGGAVRSWVQNLIELARIKVDDLMGGLHCRVSPTLFRRISTQEEVEAEFLRLLGCKDEPSAETAERWSGFLSQMAIDMNMTNAKGDKLGHMAIDGVH